MLHLAGLGAERQADADLLRPLLDRVRHQAVDADRREQQRAAAEDRHQPHVEALARGRARHDLVHRPARRTPAARSPGAAVPGPRCSATAAAPACGRSTPSASGRRSARWPRRAPAPAGCTSSGRGSLFRPLSRMSPTMPMICRSGSASNSRITPLPMTSRSVSGSPFGQKLLRHRLVDDAPPAAPAVVALGERAAALDRDLEDLEVAGRHRHPAAAAVERALAAAARPTTIERQAVAALRAARSRWRSPRRRPAAP